MMNYFNYLYKSLIIFSFFNLTVSYGQSNFCLTDTPQADWLNEFQNLVLQQKLHSGDDNITYTIPVIFHVIHGGQPVGTFPNIVQAQINSQIPVLNQDYAGIGFNSGTYPVNAFVNWAVNQNLPAANRDSLGRVKIANFNIIFCLAEKDTNGNTMPEPGIERINYITRGWQNPNTFTTPAALRTYFDGTIKPQSIWNVRKYLNIWISDKNAAVPYTGYSTYPPLSGLPGIPGGGTELTDGIWCYSSAVGSAYIFPGGIYASPNVRGRTITHEAGHYLGLIHIWGDGNCITDYCNDTPPAYTSNTGFPVYPLNPGSCNSPSNSPNGEMFMNFMDYSADPAKYMFTVDQGIRAQTAMINSPFRNQLGTHGLCTAVIGIEQGGYEIIPENFALFQNYPNPFNPVTVLKFSLPVSSFVKLIIYDALGREIEIIADGYFNRGNYSAEWNASGFSSGVYFYKLITPEFTDMKKMVLVK